jgi:hypothetical protein
VDQWSYDAASKKIVIKRTLELDQPLGTGERVYRIN